MNTYTRMSLLWQLARWRATYTRVKLSRNHHRFDNPKFRSPLEAVSLIKDGSVVATAGLSANAPTFALNLAIRKLFETCGHPRNLTVIGTGGQGGRGKLPGTLEELGIEGLCTRFIAGHLETYKSMLRLADEGKLELHCLPLGVICQLYHQQAQGMDSFVTRVGEGTFVDPREGRGSPLDSSAGEQFVAVCADGLRYRIPRIDVALFNAPAADRAGNIYLKNAALLGEGLDIARAARRNNGIVLVNVGKIVEEGYDEIALPADLVDAVVYHPRTQQTLTVSHRKHWSFMTPRSQISPEEGLARVQFLCRVLKLTPRRTAVHFSTARLAAQVFAEQAHKGDLANIGTGLPEEVGGILHRQGILEHVTLFTEAGAMGGLPAPGPYFGAAVCPRVLVPSYRAFEISSQRLDLGVYGALQVDGEGNINVSVRGPKLIDYVGPGGFIDLSASAKTLIFITSWMAHARYGLNADGMCIEKRGKPKFIERVDEICFSGRQALAKGQRAFYVCEVGLFQLTPRGMALVGIMPGIDLERDILACTTMKVVLPEAGTVPILPLAILTGKGFRLTLGQGKTQQGRRRADVRNPIPSIESLILNAG